jgi:osmotically-inducible protein OsmY
MNSDLIQEERMADRWDERSRGDYRERERGMAERAGDEVRSWLGDDEAARRRHMDEVRDESRDWHDKEHRGERAWERAREAGRNMTDRDRDGRRGWSEWRDRDYPTSERSFGDTSRYATADPYSRPQTWSGSSYGAASSYGSYGTARDWQGGQGYTGRGPKGYKRSDERIREDVCDRLTEDPRIDASDIEVHVAGGEVTLAGGVRSREEKRCAEDVIERITGVREVNNGLKVRPADQVLGTARSGASVLGLSDTPPPQPTRSTK